MKKLTITLLVVVFIFLFSACGSNSSTVSEDEKADVAFATIILVDTDQIKVSITDYDPDGFYGPTFTCLIENKTDKTLMFSIENASVNGMMSDPLWAEEIAPGKKANSEISWFATELEENNIDEIANVEFTLNVYDSDDWMADYLFDDVVTINLE